MLFIETVPADGDPADRKGQIFIETVPAVAEDDDKPEDA